MNNNIAIGDSGTTQIVSAPTASLYVKNTDANNSVWIGGQSVAPGNGTEIPPLGAVTWTPPQGTVTTLYGCVDAGVSSAVSVFVSDEVTDVNDPVAIATATAEKLALQGVPNVLTTELIGQWQTPGAVIDVSQYASVLLQVSVGGSAAVVWSLDAHADVLIGKDIDLAPGVTVMNVIGPYLQIDTLANGTLVTAYGSNRLLPTMSPVNYGYNADVAKWTTGAQNMVSGTVYPMTMNGGAPTAQGDVFAEMFISNFSTGKGFFQLVDSRGNSMNFGHTGEMVTAPNAGGYLFRKIFLPRNFDQFQYVSYATGTFTAQLNLISGGM